VAHAVRHVAARGIADRLREQSAFARAGARVTAGAGAAPPPRRPAVAIVGLRPAAGLRSVWGARLARVHAG
jgi:hypothetical protein